MSFGGDTKSRRPLLSGVYARGSKRSHQSALEMCYFMERGSSVVECPTRNQVSPGSNPSIATVSKIRHFRSLHWRPCSLSCINEYLAIDSGGNVSDLALAGNCCLARMLPGEAELVSEWTGLPGEAKSVKRFEWSNGLDTALYKNYLYRYLSWTPHSSIEKDNSLNHSCVSPKMGCLKYT